MSLKNTKNWLLVFIWVGLIFFLSHQPDLESGLPQTFDFLFGKLAHFLEYAVLTFLLIRALSNYQISKRKILCLAVALSILYAFSDEYHQGFIPGRDSSFNDIVVDSLGILLTAWLNKGKMIK
ncbi:MAG: VanZ family protein [Parcubacteria group bacterium]|nr:VanZ family protein [Parcubacteria group bacterium]